MRTAGLYGVSLQELISIFGLVVSKEQRICGVDVRVIPSNRFDELVDYLADHKCEPNEEGAMEVVFQGA